MSDSSFKPSRYYVFCSVSSTDFRNKTGVYTFRVGITNDLDAVPAMIADDRRDATSTFGGMIARPTVERTYSVFEAVWTKLDV